MARKSRRSSREAAAPTSSKRAPKQKQQVVVVEDYLEEEEEGFNFKIEDPAAFITLGIYGFLLLLPTILIGIWSASTKPSFWDTSRGPYPAEVLMLSAGESGHLEGSGLSANAEGLPQINMQQTKIEPWQYYKEDGTGLPLKLVPIDYEQDPRIGFMTISDERRTIEEIMIMDPTEADSPYVSWISGQMTTNKVGVAFKDAVVTYHVVNSRDTKVYAKRRMWIPVWIRPVKNEGGRYVMDEYNRALNHDVAVSFDPEMDKELKKLVPEGKSIRDEFEGRTVYMEPGEMVGDAFPLIVASGNSLDSEILNNKLKLTITFKNMSAESLTKQVIAVDLYNKGHQYIGSWIGTGGYTIAPNGEFTVIARILFDAKDPVKRPHTGKNNIRVRGFGTR